MTETNDGSVPPQTSSTQATTDSNSFNTSCSLSFNKDTILVEVTTTYHLDPELKIIGSGRRRTYKSPSECFRGVYDLFVEMSRSEIHPSQIDFLELQIYGRSMEELPDLLGDGGDESKNVHELSYPDE
ncbi:hypothetical protein V865_008525 [Kwoniella europaea PYCC6329]|uniref:Uncharacterized protein n=1 Tax=Kwoniella europaea PYCC6329 TaxID=1423913 RepID=A0AAX4KXQ4_9TREE